MAFDRKSYSGPMKNRGTVNGKADVSKEELDDFRAKFGKDKTLRDLLNADKRPAPKAEAPKAEAPKPAATPQKSSVETMRDTTTKKYDKDRLAEAKKTAVSEPKTETKLRGRSAAANRKKPKADSSSAPVKVGSGGSNIERMRNTIKDKFGMKSGGSVSRRGDGIARKGKTKGKFV